MLNIPLWQLIVFVLSGVALGAIVAILALAKGRQSAGEPARTPVSPAIPGAAIPNTAPAKAAPAKATTDPAAVLTAALTRQERIKTFLRNRLAKGQNVSVDEASKALDVSSRRVRRLLDDGALVAIPLANGGRLVSAVSVLDLIVRREASQMNQPGVAAQGEPAGGPTKPSAAAVDADGALKAGPRQLYWYYVAGQDKPLGSIREALQVLGLNYAYTGWGEIPTSIKAKIRRERVTQWSQDEHKTIS